MDNKYTTEAINLKSYSLSESDKIILMYSKDKGLIRSVAKGVKKIKSKLGGRMESFVANKLLISKGKNLDTICQAEAVNTFKNLRNNMDKLLLGSYISEIVSVFGFEGDLNSSEIYDTFFKALNRLANSQNKTEILFNVIKYQLKIMDKFGYKLSLNSCIKCGTNHSENWFFSNKTGGIVCANCTNNLHDLVKIPEKIKQFLIDLETIDFDSPTRYDNLVNEKVCYVCFNLLKNYIQSCSDKEIKTAKMLEIL